MNKEEKINQLVKARNLISEVFNNSKDDWKDSWYTHEICQALGSIDLTISKLNNPKPTGVKSIC